MGKKQYIPVSTNNKLYKLYFDDIKGYKRIAKKKTPVLPSYNKIDPSPSLNSKLAEMTDIEF